MMDILNFQSENPSGVDGFRGESHDRVAQAMHDYLKNKKNHKVIGLDGEFGSGKSSILQMLERKIALEGANSKLWIFDCEQNYQGSIKSNFIELFTDQIVSMLAEQRRDKDIPDVVKNRDIALGRHFSYTKDTRSHISVWAVLLIASGVLSPTFIRDYLPQLRGVTDLAWWKHTFYLLASSAPVIILGLAFFFNRKEQPGKKRWNISSLLKGSSDDQISETIEISKEVSPLDLKRALAKHLHAVKSHHFIIVIDNLDRLPRDILRSVWSDLEIFTSVTDTENLSVIVPFCSNKVSKYLNGDDEHSYDSKDFIAKKFPVVFRTPPIITSGWKDAFRTLWSQSFGSAYTSDADTCSVILQRHSPMVAGLVTPRLQKRFINDIATTLLVTADQPSVACIAAYIAICKYNSVAIEVMLKGPSASKTDEEVALEDGGADSAARKAVLSMDKTKRALKALLGEDMKSGWPIQMLQIHFQTSADIAIAELIDQPLADAIESQDGKKLASLILYFGFMDSFVRGLEGNVSPNNIFQTLHKASAVDGCNIESLLEPVSNKFRIGNQLRDHLPEIDYFDAIKGLISLGLQKSIFESALIAAKEKFESVNRIAFDLVAAEKLLEVIYKYDKYLDAMSQAFEPMTLDSSEVLFHLIVPDPKLKVIDPELMRLSDQGLIDAVLQITATEELTFNMTPLSEGNWLHCLNEYVGKTKLQGGSRQYFLSDEDSVTVMAALELNPDEDRLWLAVAFFKNHTSAVSLLIEKYLPLVTSVNIKIAMAVICIRLGSASLLSQITDIEEVIEEESEYWEAVIRAVTTTENLYDLCLQSESNHLVSPVLAKLIKNNDIVSVASKTVYAKFTKLCYALNKCGLSGDEFLNWFTSFDLKPENLPELAGFDPLILEEILKGSNSKLLQLRAAMLNQNFGADVEQAGWSKIIDNTETNVEVALHYMASEGLDFNGEKHSHFAISSYLSMFIKKVPFIRPSTPALNKINSILKLFDKDTRAIVGTELRSFVYAQSTDVESSIFILSEFGVLLSSITPRDAVEEERLLQILVVMHSESEKTLAASNFLESRAEQFSNWIISKDYKDTYASLVTKLKARMPTIYEDLSNTRGFKIIMKSLKKAIWGN